MKIKTALIHRGRQSITQKGLGINVPVHRASTIVSPDFTSYLARFDDERIYDQVVYGATGTRNVHALAEVVTELEGGVGTVVTVSGLSACTVTLGALLQQGDHLLITDSVYGPTRDYCDRVLGKYGVEVEYYNPTIDGSISSLIRSNTALIYLEAPGSLTFEMQNIEAITSAAQNAGVLTAIDNTWATPLYFKPLEAGIDISIQAGTKYIAGHSDLVIGLVSAADKNLYKTIADHARLLGDTAGPDDCYLALRGLRTMPLRLQQQFKSTQEIVSWLYQLEEVKAVLYPPHPSDPGHAVWKKHFSGGSGLFGLLLQNSDLKSIGRFVDQLKYFQIGSSWGGFESLVAAQIPPLNRAGDKWQSEVCLLRFHIGLEDPADLIDDLTQALEHVPVG